MIELIELNKAFDDIKAVNHVSLKIADGEVFGLVGTNGAGKSTTLRITIIPISTFLFIRQLLTH